VTGLQGLLLVVGGCLQAAAVQLLTRERALLLSLVAHVLAALCVGIAARGRAPGAAGRPHGVVAALLSLLTPPFGYAGAVLVVLVGNVTLGPLRWPHPTEQIDTTTGSPPVSAQRRVLGAEPLIDAVRFGDVHQRRAAARWLGEVGGRGATRALRRLAMDKDPQTRSTARRALAWAHTELDRGITAALFEQRKNPEAAEAYAQVAAAFADSAYLEEPHPIVQGHLLQAASKAYVRSLFGAEDRYPEVLLGLGRTMVHLDQLALAERFLDRAARTPDTSARALAWRLEVDYRQGRIADLVRYAREHMQERAPLCPEDKSRFGQRLTGILSYWLGELSSDAALERPLRAQPEGPEGVEGVEGVEPGPENSRGLDAEVLSINSGLRSADPASRDEAFSRLCAYRDDEAVDVIAESLLQANDAARVLFCRYLGQLGTECAAGWLCHFLQSGRESLELAAAEALRAVPAPAKLNALREALWSSTTAARSYAAEELSRLGADDVGPALAWLLHDDRIKVVRAVASGLVRLRASDQAEAVIPLLASKRVAIRVTGGLTLSALNPTLAAASLAPLMEDDPSPEMRQVGAWALGRCGEPISLTALNHALEEERHPQVLGELARALEPAGGAAWAAPKLLMLATGDRGRDARRIAELLFDALPEEAKRPALLAAITLDDPRRRRAALQRMGASGNADDVEKLAAHLETETNAEARLACLDALGVLGDSRAEPALEAALAGEQAEAYAAALALAEIGSPSALAALESYLDSDPEIRSLVEHGLLRAAAHLSREAMSPSLVRRASAALDSPSPGTRLAAARVLGRFGALASQGPLIACLDRETNPAIRDAIEHAIASCGVTDASHDEQARAAVRTLEAIAGASSDPQDAVASARASLITLAHLGPEGSLHTRLLERVLAVEAGLLQRTRSAKIRPHLERWVAAHPGSLVDLLEAEPDKEVATRALGWLRHLAELGILPDPEGRTVADALGGDDPEIRLAAAECLSTLRAPQALPLLVQLAMTAEHKSVAAAARSAVRSYIREAPRPRDPEAAR
jgi:HEAT repeat protein